MVGWWDGGMAGWWDGGMAGWRDGGMVGWWDDGMVGWWDGGVEVRHCVCKAQEHKLTCKAVCQGGTKCPGGVLAGWGRKDWFNGCIVGW